MITSLHSSLLPWMRNTSQVSSELSTALTQQTHQQHVLWTCIVTFLQIHFNVQMGIVKFSTQ